MKKLLFSLFAVAVIFAIAYANQKTIITSTVKSVHVATTGSYANSQVDTVWFTRREGMSAISFALETLDSVSITNAILFRQFDGSTNAVIAGDTLFSSYAAENAGIKIATITMNPLADIYFVKVTYAGSANGVTTPTVKYGITTSYAK